ncbi:MAG: SDR family oxidoreductase [Chloroflexi bacterium]|nr:SDR family oxidoreductase [Chloroflexota bacterium]
MDLGLAGARVFVAASRSGLGAAAAHQFSREGAHVAINGRDPETLQATADAIQNDTGKPVHAITANLLDGDAVRAAIVEAAAKLGGLDILVTNAGGPPAGKFEDFSTAQWQEAFDGLLMSVVHMVTAALPYLRKSEIPSVLAVTSLTVKQPADNLLLSNTMRAGVAGLIKTLANTYGPEGIRFNAILPGWTETDRVIELLEAGAQSTGRSMAELRLDRTRDIPLNRIADPEEFARAAVFLSSPAASFITGVMLAVDGGQIRATM